MVLPTPITANGKPATSHDRFNTRQIMGNLFGATHAIDPTIVPANNKAFVTYLISDYLIARIDSDIQTIKEMHQYIERVTPGLLIASKNKEIDTIEIQKYKDRASHLSNTLAVQEKNCAKLRTDAPSLFTSSLQIIMNAPGGDIDGITQEELRRRKATVTTIRNLQKETTQTVTAMQESYRALGHYQDALEKSITSRGPKKSEAQPAPVPGGK